MLKSIDEFCPPGMQIAQPQGLMLNPQEIVAIEMGPSENPWLKIIFKQEVVYIKFYLNTTGGKADHYALAHNLRKAANVEAN